MAGYTARLTSTASGGMLPSDTRARRTDENQGFTLDDLRSGSTAGTYSRMLWLYGPSLWRETGLWIVAIVHHRQVPRGYRQVDFDNLQRCYLKSSIVPYIFVIITLQNTNLLVGRFC